MRKIEIPTQQRNGVSAEKLGAYNRMGITGSRNRVLKKKLGFYDHESATSNSTSTVQEWSTTPTTPP